MAPARSRRTQAKPSRAPAQGQGRSYAKPYRKPAASSSGRASPPARKPAARRQPQKNSLTVFDVRSHAPVPRPYPDGSSLEISDKVTDSVEVSNKRRMLFVTNPGTASATATMVDLYLAAAMTGPWSLPILDNDPPLSACAAKCGVEIVSTGKSMDVSGTVYVANLTSRLELPYNPERMGTGDWNAVADSIIGMRGTETLGAEQFRRPRTFSTSPVDMNSYNSFRSWDGPLDNDDFFRSFATWADEPPPDGVMSTLPHKNTTRALSTICVIFEAVPHSTPQTYRFTAHASMRGRYPASRLLNRLQSMPPTAAPEVINAQMQKAERSRFSAAANAAAGAAVTGLTAPLWRKKFSTRGDLR